MRTLRFACKEQKTTHFKISMAKQKRPEWFWNLLSLHLASPLESCFSGMKKSPWRRILSIDSLAIWSKQYLSPPKSLEYFSPHFPNITVHTFKFGKKVENLNFVVASFGDALVYCEYRSLIHKGTSNGMINTYENIIKQNNNLHWGVMTQLVLLLLFSGKWCCSNR